MIESDFFKELEKALKLNDFSTSYNTVIPKIFGSSLAELENNVFHVSYSFVEEDVNFTGFFKEFCLFLQRSQQDGLFELPILFSSIEVTRIEESYIACCEDFLKEDHQLYKFAKGELNLKDYTRLFIDEMERLELFNLDKFKAIPFFDVANDYLGKMLNETKLHICSE